MAPQLISFPSDSNGLFAVIVAFSIALFIVLPRLRRQDLALFLSGAGLFWLAAQNVIESRLAREYEGDSILTELRVADFPRIRNTSTSFLATPVDDARVPGRVLLSWHEPPVVVRLGDVWRMEIRLRRPRGASNPGSMDYEAWLFRERIGASGYVVSGKRNVLLDSNTATGIERLRQDFLHKAQSVLGDDIALPVIVAVAIGARHLISTEAWDRYARTGTSHLMAISGLHVGLAGVAAYFLAAGLFGLLARGNHHVAALLAALAVACAYATISGFAVPAQRATAMLAITTLILLRRREVSVLRLLAAAVMAIVVTDPLATMQPGFKLSFAAVAILFWFARWRQARPAHAAHAPLHALRSLAMVQVMLFMGLLPLTISIFGTAAIAAPILNLIAVPLFTFITVPFVLLGLVSSVFFDPLADLALRVAALSVGWLEYLVLIAAQNSFASMPVAAIESLAWLLLIVPFIWVALPSGWPARHVAWLGAMSLLMWRPESPPNGCVDIQVLDVGQGLSLVLRTNDRVLVYDTGPVWRSGGSAGERVLVPYLRHRGIRRVDRLIVSHSDLDHAGGVQALIRAMPVSDILVGEAMPWVESPQRACRAGTAWSWNDVRFSILNPGPSAGPRGNAASCVVQIEAGNYRALLSGDIESETEAMLVRQRVLMQVDFVTVPHHGSRTSSNAPFVRSLTPALAVVSAGYGNRWGFPKPDVVARWRSTGAHVLNTATSGAIHVRMCAKTGISAPQQWRNKKRRIWHGVDS